EVDLKLVIEKAQELTHVHRLAEETSSLHIHEVFDARQDSLLVSGYKVWKIQELSPSIGISLAEQLTVGERPQVVVDSQVDPLRFSIRLVPGCGRSELVFCLVNRKPLRSVPCLRLRGPGPGFSNPAPPPGKRDLLELGAVKPVQ